MKICILGIFKHHTECVGFLLDALSQNELVVCISDERFGYVKYFRQIYKFNEINHKDFNENNYDFVIILSANDPTVNSIINKKKYITIVHHINFIIDKGVDKYIAFNDDNIISAKFHKIIPLYKGIYNHESTYKKYNKFIMYIGPLNYNIDKDLQKFIDLVNYNFIMIHEQKYYEMAAKYFRQNKKFHVYGTATKIKSNFFVATKNKHKKIFVLKNVSTEKILHLMQNISFFLIRKNKITKNIMSGAIPLALSHNTPIIIQSNNKVVNAQKEHIGIEYKNNYCDCASKLNNLSLNNYLSLCNNIAQFTEKIRNLNKISLNNILV
jgi:hypothetical protein